MKFFTSAIALVFATSVLASTDLSQKVNNLNLDKSTCNTGLGQIASKCEKCARTGIECLRYPDMKKDLCEGGVDSPHSKNCNGCIDKIFELLN
ncbi:hypothetical protein CBS9595_003800 [Malassezia furfur]|nr:hypothetical protein CBS9595_003800 [Malassezia furfur]